jgi:hypothetical protein
MASFVLINPVAYLDTYALQAEIRALGLQLGTATKDNTSAASGGSQLGQPGLKTVAASLKAFTSFGASPAGIVKTLFNRQRTTDIPYMVSPAGGPVGDVAFFMKTRIGSFSPLAGNIGDEVSTDVSLALSSSDLALGQILLAEAARGASANSAVTALGAIAATQKLYGVVHVLAASGSSPTLDIVVKSATLVGFGSPTTRVTVPQFTAVGSYWIELTGPVTDTFWRVDCTIGGSSPSFRFVVALGIDT